MIVGVSRDLRGDSWGYIPRSLFWREDLDRDRERGFDLCSSFVEGPPRRCRASRGGSPYCCSGPALHEMTPGTINSRLMQNPPPTTPYVSPTKNDWDMLFQLMFEEYFNPPPSVVSPVRIDAAPRPADPTGSPSSTTINQAAPFTSTSSTIHETQSPVIFEGVEKQLQPTQHVDDPFLDLLSSELSSHESSSNV
ncbi:hypothetical protein Tco_0627152 [Tanacetum coccineum]|uniref:Uncharacterized protein n=1 Tax=Tanacetum coccineum TaxID=301880 RepID=A0ABQ4WLK6_9ASTR